MSIPDTVNLQLKESIRARDSARTGALRMIKAALLEAEKKTGSIPNDGACQEILRRLRKQRDEAATQYRAGGREELAASEEAEIIIIDAFLPQLADEATTRQWVQEAIAASGATQPGELGRVMGALMKSHKAEIDGTLARTLVQEELSG